MRERMTIYAQITDLHLDNEDPNINHLNSRANALALLNAIQEQNIERLILTGDIAETRNGVDWFLNEIDKRKFNYEVIMGNHDIEQAYIEKNIFKGTKSYYSRQSDGFLLLFLDSGENKIDQEQLDWIDEQLSHAASEVLIFVHHPVLDCGDTIMDKKYPLENRDEVLSVFTKANRKIAIFCGHYHVEEIVERGNIVQYVTPSALYQIKKYAAQIETESEAIGYRILSTDNGSYTTQVKYLEPHD
jgi:Icc protein